MIERISTALGKAGVRHRRDEPLARHTTLGIGGPTPCFIEPDDAESLRRAVTILGESQLPFRVLGAGSNLLVVDEPLEFAVIATSRLARPATIDGVRVVVDAGVFLPTLVRDVSKRGLAGLEFGIGVPGSVGGALRMNAGGWGSDMSRVVRAVRAVRLDDGEVVDAPFTPRFRYRSAGVDSDVIVTEVEMELSPGDADAILRTIEGYTTERRKTQPTSSRSAGCAFRNPSGDSAGRLIDGAGLKGLRRGAAEVSTLHANFVVNRGGATAADVIALVAEVKKRVHDEHGIEMQEEIVVWQANG